MPVVGEDENQDRMPLGMVLLCWLYLFFFLLTASTFGQPYPFFGFIYQGEAAKIMIFFDSLISLYLVLGIMKRQRASWYLLIAYNLIELVNTLTNLVGITSADLEKVVAEKVDSRDLIVNNLSVIVLIIALTATIYRLRTYFTNRSPYLF